MPTDFDAISEERLRAAGSMKWSAYPGTIGAWVAEMDFGVAEPIASAVSDALSSGLTGYLPAALSTDLAAATSQWYERRYGWRPDPERIHPVPDVITAYQVAIERFSAPGSAVIVPTPAYMPFLFVPPMQDRRVIEVPSIEVDGRMTMDLDGISRAFEDGGGLVVLCNPHNPLGTVFTRTELLALAEVVDAHDGRVFSDEIHAPIVYGGAEHVPYASVSDTAAGHTVTAASASKAWNLAGLKCAQVILSNDVDAAAWAEFGPWAGHGTATVGVIANIAAYRDGESWLEGVVDYLDGNRRALVDGLARHAPHARVAMPEGSYIALIDLRAYALEGDLGEWFRENAQVAMTDGRACGEAGVGQVRFVFALPRPLLEVAIERIGAALAGVPLR